MEISLDNGNGRRDFRVLHDSLPYTNIHLISLFEIFCKTCLSHLHGVKWHCPNNRPTLTRDFFLAVFIKEGKLTRAERLRFAMCRNDTINPGSNRKQRGVRQAHERCRVRRSLRTLLYFVDCYAILYLVDGEAEPTTDLCSLANPCVLRLYSVRF